MTSRKILKFKYLQNCRSFWIKINTESLVKVSSINSQLVLDTKFIALKSKSCLENQKG